MLRVARATPLGASCRPSLCGRAVVEIIEPGLFKTASLAKFANHRRGGGRASTQRGNLADLTMTGSSISGLDRLADVLLAFPRVSSQLVDAGGIEATVRCWTTIPYSAHRSPRRDSLARGSAARAVSCRHTCPQPAHLQRRTTLREPWGATRVALPHRLAKRISARHNDVSGSTPPSAPVRPHSAGNRVFVLDDLGHLGVGRAGRVEDVTEPFLSQPPGEL